MDDESNSIHTHTNTRAGSLNVHQHDQTQYIPYSRATPKCHWAINCDIVQCMIYRHHCVSKWRHHLKNSHVLMFTQDHFPSLTMTYMYYLKDRFNYEYLILRSGYPSHFAGTNNCGIAEKKQNNHTH